MPLATDRTESSTDAEHVSDHNTAHGILNTHPTDTATHGVADVAALLDEPAHDALDHTGLTGVGGTHPDLAAHDTLGLATQSELDAHAHGGVYEPVATAHASRHNAGGADALAVDAAAGTGSLRTLGTGATQAAVGSHTHIGSIVLAFALSDETTAITTGTAKLTARMPFAMTLTGVRASLNTASTSGIPTVDINEGGTTILSTKLTIDANEKTSTTAAAPAVISDSALADDAEITFDIDVAGTGATGLKVYLLGTTP